MTTEPLARKALEGVQFTKDGPIIPLKLLQELEDEKLVIFCGAGISKQCGLPDFKELVLQVEKHLGRTLEPDEQNLFENDQYDAALGLIERRIIPGKLREAVAAVLEVRPDADLATHEALLKLATSKHGGIRLVTTNFDCAFERVHGTARPSFDYAPYLPTPNKSWSSVVHLHGGLDDPRNTDFQNLVLTSADFGRAYLTEGWAGRFLTDLFRHFDAILFVGYSVSDPAIRYIVDAFAAD